MVENNECALEFACDGIFLLVFIRFWQGDQLCRAFLKRTGRTQRQSQAEVTLISHVIGTISTGPQIVRGTGSTSHTVQLMDKSQYGQHAVQNPPCFEELQKRTLMHKMSSSVFGRIDFFAVFFIVSYSSGQVLS